MHHTLIPYFFPFLSCRLLVLLLLPTWLMRILCWKRKRIRCVKAFRLPFPVSLPAKDTNIVNRVRTSLPANQYSLLMHLPCQIQQFLQKEIGTSKMWRSTGIKLLLPPKATMQAVTPPVYSNWRQHWLLIVTDIHIFSWLWSPFAPHSSATLSFCMHSFNLQCMSDSREETFKLCVFHIRLKFLQTT